MTPVASSTARPFREPTRYVNIRRMLLSNRLRAQPQPRLVADLAQDARMHIDCSSMGPAIARICSSPALGAAGLRAILTCSWVAHRARGPALAKINSDHKLRRLWCRS